MLGSPFLHIYNDMIASADEGFQQPSERLISVKDSEAWWEHSSISTT
jgi:hypothetical protein